MADCCRAKEVCELTVRLLSVELPVQCELTVRLLSVELSVQCELTVRLLSVELSFKVMWIRQGPPASTFLETSH